MHVCFVMQTRIVLVGFQTFFINLQIRSDKRRVNLNTGPGFPRVQKFRIAVYSVTASHSYNPNFFPHSSLAWTIFVSSDWLQPFVIHLGLCVWGGAILKCSFSVCVKRTCNKCQQSQESIRAPESEKGSDQGHGEACQPVTFRTVSLYVDSDAVKRSSSVSRWGKWLWST